MSSRTLRDVIATSFWALLNAVSSRLLNLLIMLLAARALETDEYGALALTLNSAQAWSLLIGAGFSLTLSRFVASYRANDAAHAPGLVATSMLVAFLLTLAITLVLMFFSETISSQYFSGSLQPGEVRVAGLWTFLLAMTTVVQGALTGFEAFRQNAVIALGCGLVALLLVLAGPSSDPQWVIGALIAGNILVLLLSGGLLLQRLVPLRRPGIRLVDVAYLGPVVQFGLPALLGGVIVTQSQWHANVQVAAGAGGLENMAGLSIALQWYAIVLFVPGVIANSLLPMLSRMEGDRGTANRVFLLGLAVNALVAVVMAAFTVAVRHRVLELYGTRYTEFSDTFMMLVLAACVAGSAAMVLQKIVSHGRAAVLLVITVIWSLVFFATLDFRSDAALVPLDVAVGYLVANAVQAALAVMWILYRKDVEHAS